jgi:hypothetical protein
LLRRGDGVGSRRHVEIKDAAGVRGCRGGHRSIGTRCGDSCVLLRLKIAGGARRLSYAGGNGSRSERERSVDVALTRHSRRRQGCSRGRRAGAPADHHRYDGEAQP